MAVKTMRGVCVRTCVCARAERTLSNLLPILQSFHLWFDLVGTHSHQDLEEFLREAELMQNFHHENVVRLLGKTVILVAVFQ